MESFLASMDATVIRRLRLDAALRDVPCLLLTASEDVDSELRALDARADGFVRKEASLDVILAKLAAVLRRVGARTHGDETCSALATKKVLAVDDSPTPTSRRRSRRTCENENRSVTSTSTSKRPCRPRSTAA